MLSSSCGEATWWELVLAVVMSSSCGEGDMVGTGSSYDVVQQLWRGHMFGTGFSIPGRCNPTRIVASLVTSTLSETVFRDERSHCGPYLGSQSSESMSVNRCLIVGDIVGFVCLTLWVLRQSYVAQTALDFTS